MLLLVCCTEAAAFGVGTLTATTAHLLSPILLGIGVFVALFAWSYTKWAAVGMFTAIVFAVGVGLPGYSIQSAGLRTFFSLIGMLWALLGIEIHRFVISHRIQLSGPGNVLLKAISSGYTNIKAVTSDSVTKQGAAMCGCCRQDYMYLNPDCVIYFFNPDKTKLKVKLIDTMKYPYLSKGMIK